MALHVALCRHLDHAEQHSAELVRRLRPSPLHRINILVGSGVASRYTQRRLATYTPTFRAFLAPATQSGRPTGRPARHRTPRAGQRLTLHPVRSCPPDRRSRSQRRQPAAARWRRCRAAATRPLRARPAGPPRAVPARPAGPAGRAGPHVRRPARRGHRRRRAGRLGAGPPAARARPGARLRTLARAARDAQLQRPAGRLPGRTRRAAAHLARDARRGAADRHRHLRPDPPPAPADPPGRARHRGALRRPRAG